MNYTRNHLRNLLQKNCAENCVLLSFQSFPCAIKRCVSDVLFFQGCFDKIYGLLGKIQGLFKDLNKFFNFQGLFKGLMLFQGLFKARANHVGLSTLQCTGLWTCPLLVLLVEEMLGHFIYLLV